MSKIFVLSVGGSLIVPPAGVDTNFLREFKSFIIGYIKKGYRFYLVIGGGTTARQYIKAAQTVSKVDNEARDWLGISATRLNAQLLKTIFGKLVYPEIISNPLKTVKTDKKIILAAGYEPGCSTDYDAVLLGKKNHAGVIINLSNIDYAYDKDPKKFPDAKKLVTVSWSEFRRIVGSRWQPGLNAPFDPVASKEAAKQGMKVIILNGRKLGNLGKCLLGKDFEGTTIS